MIDEQRAVELNSKKYRSGTELTVEEQRELQEFKDNAVDQVKRFIDGIHELCAKHNVYIHPQNDAAGGLFFTYGSLDWVSADIESKCSYTPTDFLVALRNSAMKFSLEHKKETDHEA